MNESVKLALITAICSLVGSAIGTSIIYLFNKRLADHQAKLNRMAKNNEKITETIEALYKLFIILYSTHQRYVLSHITAAERQKLAGKLNSLETEINEFSKVHALCIPITTLNLLHRFMEAYYRTTLVFDHAVEKCCISNIPINTSHDNFNQFKKDSADVIKAHNNLLTEFQTIMGTPDKID